MILGRTPQQSETKFVNRIEDWFANVGSDFVGARQHAEQKPQFLECGPQNFNLSGTRSESGLPKLTVHATRGKRQEQSCLRLGLKTLSQIFCSTATGRSAGENCSNSQSEGSIVNGRKLPTFLNRKQKLLKLRGLTTTREEVQLFGWKRDLTPRCRLMPLAT